MEYQSIKLIPNYLLWDKEDTTYFLDKLKKCEYAYLLQLALHDGVDIDERYLMFSCFEHDYLSKQHHENENLNPDNRYWINVYRFSLIVKQPCKIL